MGTRDETKFIKDYRNTKQAIKDIQNIQQYLEIHTSKLHKRMNILHKQDSLQQYPHIPVEQQEEGQCVTFEELESKCSLATHEVIGLADIISINPNLLGFVTSTIVDKILFWVNHTEDYDFTGESYKFLHLTVKILDHIQQQIENIQEKREKAEMQ